MIVGKSRALTEGLRLLRFGIVGVAALAVYWLAANALTRFGRLPLLTASIIGYGAAGLTSYIGHTHFSFRVAANHRNQGSKFLVVALLGLLVNVVLIQVCSTFRMSAWVTTAIIGLSMPLINYAFARMWVFGSALDEAGPTRETR